VPAAAPRAGAPRFYELPGATLTTIGLADPALDVAAKALAVAIPERVPVHEGVAKRTYRPTVTRLRPGRVVVGVHSPFWHFLEFGTRFNPPYRPVQRAAEGIGLEYEPR
jgi:hypothetical protein